MMETSESIIIKIWPLIVSKNLTKLLSWIYSVTASAPVDECDDTLFWMDDEDLDQMPGSTKLWRGKDYTNFIVQDFNNLESPYQDLVDRSTTPRMPWHDVGVMVQAATARDVARHFIQRWNAIKVSAVVWLLIRNLRLLIYTWL